MFFFFFVTRCNYQEMAMLRDNQLINGGAFERALVLCGPFYLFYFYRSKRNESYKRGNGSSLLKTNAFPWAI